MRKLRNKQQARKLHREGNTIILTPSNMSPDSFIKATLTPDMEFDKFLNEFEYYNCNKETGNYAHFYIDDR